MSNVDSKSLQVIAAFVFGVIFVSVILILVFSSKSIDSNKMWVVKIVMSLAAAGVAAVLPGFIDFEGRLPWLNVTLIRSGGALAIFCLVLLYPLHSGPKNDEEIYTPPTNAGDKAGDWVTSITNKDYTSAYNSLSLIAKKENTQQEFTSLMSSIMDGLGGFQEKRKVGVVSFRVPPAPGADNGDYRSVTYRLKCNNYPEDAVIEVILRGEEETHDWQVYHFSFGRFTDQGAIVPLKL